MMTVAAFKQEWRPMLHLAGPVVLAELAWMAMSIIDTLMVGRVGPAAIGAVGLGSVLYFTVAMLGMGTLLGLDTLVSHAFGANRLDECNRALLHGVYLSLLLTPVLMGMVWLSIPLIERFGIHPEVLVQTIPFLKALTWGTLPLLLYASFRRYLQAINAVRPVMFALITANLVNLLGNWALIYGHLGFRALGTEGSGWSTCWARVYMAGVLIVYAILHDRQQGMGLFQVSFRFDAKLFRRLVSLGLPASLQLVLELGVFGAVTALAARTDPASLAAHQIALNAASVTYMVPLGVSAAGAVRVGQALGRGDAMAASRAGYTALIFGGGFMALMGLLFLVFPKLIFRPFTADPVVIATGISILFFAALFQLFDGLQVVATGILRGAGNTRTPMLTNLFGYWFFGLPAGYALAFYAGWGVKGLWAGLSIGLAAVGLFLLMVWVRTIGRLRAATSQ
jgi:MATE family multidrug resistance protein